MDKNFYLPNSASTSWKKQKSRNKMKKFFAFNCYFKVMWRQKNINEIKDADAASRNFPCK